jgi:hypothetical protein
VRLLRKPSRGLLVDTIRALAKALEERAGSDATYDERTLIVQAHEIDRAWLEEPDRSPDDKL